MPKRSVLNAHILVFNLPKLAFNFYEMDPRKGAEAQNFAEFSLVTLELLFSKKSEKFGVSKIRLNFVTE